MKSRWTGGEITALAALTLLLLEWGVWSGRRAGACRLRVGWLFGRLGILARLGSDAGLALLHVAEGGHVGHRALEDLPVAGEDALPMMGATGITAIVTIVLAPILVAVGLFIGAAIFHVSVLVVGGRQNPGDFESTLRSLAYSYSTQPLTIVPIVGGLVAGIWSLILYGFGFVRMHGMSGGRAAVAVLLPIMVCCVLVIVIMSMTVGLAVLSSQ